MNTCTFVRQAAGGYEYGLFHVSAPGTKHEVRRHEVLGKKPSYEAALDANAMAQKGCTRMGAYHGCHWRGKA